MSIEYYIVGSEVPLIKICVRCGVKQDISEFNKNKNKEDGHGGVCKKCTHIYYESNKEEINAKARKWQLERPERKKKYSYRLPPEEKARRLAERRALRALTPKPPRSVPDRHAYYLANKERILAKSAAWREAHKPPADPLKVEQRRLHSLEVQKATQLRKALKRLRKLQANPLLKAKYGIRKYVSWVLKPLVLQRDNYSCQMCGAQVRKDLVVHHILPASYAPERIEDFENLITLCKECHQKVHGQYWSDIDLVLAEQLALIVMVKEQPCVS